MDVPIPNSASDNTVNTSVKTVETPAYSIPKVRMKIVLVTKPVRIEVVLTDNPPIAFKKVFFVLLFFIIVPLGIKILRNILNYSKFKYILYDLIILLVIYIIINSSPKNVINL